MCLPDICQKSDRRGSNPRSRPWQGRALPTTPLSHKRVMGIEPTYPAWKAGVLPLNYTREVGVTGFEPATSWSQTRRSSQAEPHPVTLCVSFYLTQDSLYISCFCLSSTFYFFQQLFQSVSFVSGLLPSTCCIIPFFLLSVNTFFQKILNNLKNSKNLLLQAASHLI